MKLFSTLLLAAGLPFMMQAAEPTDTVTVFMIGDSTMANKPLAKENQERGWGQMLPVYLQGKIKVDNHAVNGRSSKSFINEGRWDKVMSLIRPGDYVIIQFGHNDEKPKNDRHTDPGSTFDENLRRFVNDTKSKGATPILMNSIVRRNFPPMAGQDIASESDDKQKDWKGMYPNEGVILVDTHGAYLDSPRNVAAETEVTFVDMNKLTHELVQTLGANNSRDLFMWISPNTYEFCPKGKIDNTHLNVHGALIVSRLAVNALAKQMPELRQYIRPEIYNLN